MTTLLDASAKKKLSSSCRKALQSAQTDTVFHALLRPTLKARASDTGLMSPEPINDAIRSAGATFGQGPKLIRDLQKSLRERTRSLKTWVPDATELWLADALAVRLPAVELAKLSHRSDIRLIELQPSISPARRTTESPDWATVSEAAADPLHLELAESHSPRVGLVDLSPAGLESRNVIAEASFDSLGLPNPDFSIEDAQTEAWQTTLFELVPSVQWLRAGVFDNNSPSTFAQVIAGLQWTLERGADLVLLDLGSAALDPIWHLPVLNCTLYGTSVVVSGAERSQKDRPLWPVHVPLAGCYDRGPLRTDLLVSGAPLGAERLVGSSAAAARALAAMVLLQTVAPRLRNDPAALVGFLFAGADRGAGPRGEVELNPESMLKAASSAA